MRKKQEEHIKNIISKVGIDKAPIDFTSKVMEDLFVSTNVDALKSKELSSLLQRTILEKPSNDFVSSIMNQVETKKEIEYQPLISKKGWFVISGFILAFMLFVTFSNSPKETSSIVDEISPYLNEINSLFSNPFKDFTISPVLMISILCLTTLLLLDTFLKKRSFL